MARSGRPCTPDRVASRRGGRETAVGWAAIAQPCALLQRALGSLPPLLSRKLGVNNSALVARSRLRWSACS